MARLDWKLSDVTWVDDRRVDVGSEASFQAILDGLEAEGYRLGYDLRGDPDAEAGTSAYVYIMPDIARIKCHTCGGLSSIDGSLRHGKQCDHCKKVICRTIYPGAVISFSFDKLALAGPCAWLTVVRWDEVEGYLYCDRRFPDNLSRRQLQETFMLLRHHKDRWVSAKGENGSSLLKFRFPTEGDDRAIYSAHSDSPDEIGYDEVLYWKGSEYPAQSSDPALPQTFKIYKKW